LKRPSKIFLEIIGEENKKWKEKKGLFANSSSYIKPISQISDNSMMRSIKAKRFKEDDYEGLLFDKLSFFVLSTFLSRKSSS
jgi:hypothetical protein